MERELHTEGFVCVGRIAAPSPQDLRTTTDYHTIFNCNDASLTRPHKRARWADQYSGDEKRTQARVTATSCGWRRFRRDLSRLLSKALPHHDVGKTLTLGETVVIASQAGCQQQAAHTDHVPSLQLQRLVNDNPEKLPLAMLVAVQAGTTLEVWPRSIGLVTRSRDKDLPTTPLPPRTVQLPTGSVMVFRADLVHAGSAYATNHRRLHLFVESTAFQREADTTFIIRDADPSLAAILLPSCGVKPGGVASGGVESNTVASDAVESEGATTTSTVATQ